MSMSEVLMNNPLAQVEINLKVIHPLVKVIHPLVNIRATPVSIVLD